MPKITIDLETIPCQNDELKELIKAKVKPPKTIKLQKSTDKWDEEKRHEAEEKAVLKTSFRPLFGEIIVIGYAIDDEPAQSIARKEDELESDMLKRFWDELSDALVTDNNITWIGHNIIMFDLPFLYNRCMINNVKPISLPRNPKPWEIDVFDTLYEIMGNDIDGGSLDNVARVLGLGKKTEGMDGSKVWPEYKSGNIDKIESYCRDDVELARKICKRILFIDSIVDLERQEYI